MKDTVRRFRNILRKTIFVNSKNTEIMTTPKKYGVGSSIRAS